MPLRNIRPLQVLWQDGIETEALNSVYLGIWRVLSLAGVTNEIKVESLEQRRQPDYLNPTGRLMRYKSLDWHIGKAHKRSRKTGHLNSITLLDSLAKDPAYKSNPGYELIIVNEPIHWEDTPPRTISGVCQPGQSAIVSLASFLHILQPVVGETDADKNKKRSEFLLSTKIITMHELGHLFGLFTRTTGQNPTDQELTETHCSNECAMRCWQDIDIIQRIKNNPFCPSCLEKLKQFFIQP